jgi:predicted HTH transcriptional regulator
VPVGANLKARSTHPRPQASTDSAPPACPPTPQPARRRSTLLHRNRREIRTGADDKEIERIIVKTVAAFMNTNAGTLVIGVNDSTRELRGLGRDIATLGRKDLDGYEQLLRQTLNNALGPANSSRITISFPASQGKIACVVEVPRSPRAVYARNGAEADFFIRDGNLTRRLNSQETVRFCADRFVESG